MSEPDTKLLAYVGRKLGSEPVTTLRGGNFHVTWSRLSRTVRAVPAEDAADLLRRNPGQFAEALTLPQAAVKWSIKADRLTELGDKLTTGSYQRKGEEPQIVVLLDEHTQAGIDAEHKRAAKAKDKE